VQGLQAVDSRVSLTERHGTILSGCRPPTVVNVWFWHAVQTTSRLRSSLTHQLDVRQSQCAIVGDRAFATAGARLWNSLSTAIVAREWRDTLPHSAENLKPFLFRQSYPAILL